MTPMRRLIALAGLAAAATSRAADRDRGTKTEFQLSMVAPHNLQGKLSISRRRATCSVRL